MSYKSLIHGCCQIYQQKPNNKFNGHEYVDLGLPSGTKWAKMNVGAQTETDYGLYFAWGETQGYTASQVGTDKQFSQSDYKFNPSGDGETMSKYNTTDGKTVLDLEDDVAHVNMGGDWHMPNIAQCIELFKETKNGFVTNAGAFAQFAWDDNGGYSSPVGRPITISDWNTAGYFFFKNSYTSVTDAISAEDYLFVPAAGDCANGEVYGVGYEGYVWGSALISENVKDAWGFDFVSDEAGVGNDSRCYGRSVRGVVGQIVEQEESQPEEQHIIQQDEVGYMSYGSVTYLIVGTENYGESKRVKMSNRIEEYRYAIITDMNAIGMNVADAYQAGYITMGDEVPSDDTESVDMVTISGKIIHNAVPRK